MHSWFTQKLNEMTALAHYCHFSILEAHFILAQNAVDEMHGKAKAEENCLQQLLPIMISQAEVSGHTKAAEHLQKALDALGPREAASDNVIPVDFQPAQELRNGFGA